MKHDCPHCFARVLPPSDGQCPSCRGDLSAPKRLPLSTVRIQLGVDLPGLCVACGQKTLEIVRVRRSKSEGGHAWPLKLLALITSPFLFAATQREFQANERELSIALPFCKACSAGGKEPRPTFVNFERQEFTFIVHDAFANAFRGM